MSTPPPNDPRYPQQPGATPPPGEGYPTQQQGYYQQPPEPKKSPWPWVMGIVALLVAGAIAAILITDSNDKKPATTVNHRTTVNKTITTPATTTTTTNTITVTTPTVTVTTPASGGATAP